MSQSKFHHEEIYRGKDLVKKLSSYSITVCGAGALGSNLVDNMVRQGFANIKVIDKDRVEQHNISTQIYAEGDIGALKVAALQNRMFAVAGTEIETIDKELTGANVKKFLKGSSLVIDAFDNSASRRLIQDECRRAKLPCLHAGLSADYGEVVWDEDYRVPKDAEGDVCDYPLARNLILLVISVASEQILDFCLSKKPQKVNKSITLRDFAIKMYS